MAFNLVLMLIGLSVGYVEQSKWIFVTALVVFLYRVLEANYFRQQYGRFTTIKFNESKWTSFTTVLLLIWGVYLLYLTMGLLFKGV